MIIGEILIGIFGNAAYEIIKTSITNSVKFDQENIYQAVIS